MHNCNKKFEVTLDLIPEEWKKYSMWSCNHSWFYKIEKLS